MIIRPIAAEQPPVAEVVVVDASEPPVVGAFVPAAGLVVPGLPFALLPPQLVAAEAEPPVVAEASPLVVAAPGWLPAAAVAGAVGGGVVPPPD